MNIITTQRRFAKDRNLYQKKFPYSWKQIFIRDIRNGIFPECYFKYLKIESKDTDRAFNTYKKARQRFNANINLKNSILKRDSYKCVKCGSNGPLEIDHIKRVKDFPSLASHPSNLRSLCKKCHKLRHKLLGY